MKVLDILTCYLEVQKAEVLGSTKFALQNLKMNAILQFFSTNTE